MTKITVPLWVLVLMLVGAFAYAVVSERLWYKRHKRREEVDAVLKRERVPTTHPKKGNDT